MSYKVETSSINKTATSLFNIVLEFRLLNCTSSKFDLEYCIFGNSQTIISREVEDAMTVNQFLVLKSRMIQLVKLD